MKGVRILQLVLLVLLVVYLVLFDSANPDPVSLPLLIVLLPMRAVLVVVAALLGGWLVGWLPGRIQLWRRGRELRRLRERVATLEQQFAPPISVEGGAPVIPDRVPYVPDRDLYDDEAESA